MSASSAANHELLQNIIHAPSMMLAGIFFSSIPAPPFFHSQPIAFSSNLDANVYHHKYTTRLGLPWRTSSRRRGPPPSGAAEKEETQFEIDQEKAREALQKLDQQLQSLSQQESLPKKRPPSPSLFGIYFILNYFRCFIIISSVSYLMKLTYLVFMMLNSLLLVFASWVLNEW